MRFINELIHRRIPHIIGSYLIAGTSLILFVDWLVHRYTLPEYYTTLSLFGVVAILPSVLILAYFHGAPGKDEWTKIEKIGVPFNILFIFLVLLIGDRNQWWIIDEVNSIIINENIFVGRLISNENDIYVLNNTIDKYGIKNYDNAKNIKLNVISNNKINLLYKEIIWQLDKKNNYPINLIYMNDFEEIYIKKGDSPPYYDLRSEIDLIRNEGRNVFNYIGVLRDSSLNNIMLDNNISYSLSSVIYELENPIGGNNLVFLRVARYFEKMSADTIYTDIDTTFNLNFDAGYSINEQFILANEDNITDLISNDYLSYIEQRCKSNFGSFKGYIDSIADNKIIISFDPALKTLISEENLLAISRVYRTKDDGVKERIEDLLNFKKEIERNKLNEEIEDYNNNQGNWSKAELNDLKSNNHSLSTDNSLWWELDIPSFLKVEKVYDSTLVASYFKKVNPYIKLKLDDKIYLK